MTNPKPWRVIPKSEAAARPLGADRQLEQLEPVPVDQRRGVLGDRPPERIAYADRRPERIAYADGRRRRGP